ncbi:hypothetical protein HELRODRAFT_177827 [Helobdella robusta]|uniref:Apple domain-containing protein n=1 Tax=Helobdella robusta TaxID=6412 RepID=T1FCC0_HELRO|nr:hypothetical protein HELRODRAFT_177827 [Helobdella robusta]ESN97764.1 hypothetical protein HELRODRAFT_177827 [Helobdella robusta]
MSKIWIILQLCILEVYSRSSLATGKYSTASSYYQNSSCYHPSKGNDGNYVQALACNNCYRGSDPRGGGNWWLVDLLDVYFIDIVVVYTISGFEMQLVQFLVGLANTLGPVVRNSYELCDQYQKPIVVPGSYQVRCNANLEQYSIVIIQQPSTGFGSMAFAEMEVFAAQNPESKVWKKFAKNRLAKPASVTKIVRSAIECVIGCSIIKCYSVNYNHVLMSCEMFASLQGLPAPFILTADVKYDYLKSQYVSLLAIAMKATWIVLLYFRLANAVKNIALFKTATADSTYYANACAVASHATDGIYNTDGYKCECFAGAVKTERGLYYLCNQYEFDISATGIFTLKCNANMPAVRYVIVQARYDLPGNLNACELLVYEAAYPESKLWNKLHDHRLIQTFLFSFNTSSVHGCLIRCNLYKCGSVNYNNANTACEIFQHPFGYVTGNVPKQVIGWDHWQLFYA